MNPTVVQLNFLLALGTVAMQVAILCLLGSLVYERIAKRRTAALNRVAAWGMSLVAALAVFGTAFTLLYSEVFGFVPCSLCWFQRIFLYPQAIVAPLALFMKDTRYTPAYLIALSSFGSLFALYQHYLQMSGSPLPCPAGGGDCGQRIVFEFGYITFPLMAWSLFVLIIVIMSIVLMRRAADRAAI